MREGGERESGEGVRGEREREREREGGRGREGGERWEGGTRRERERKSIQNKSRILKRTSPCIVTFRLVSIHQKLS